MRQRAKGAAALDAAKNSNRRDTMTCLLVLANFVGYFIALLRPGVSHQTWALWHNDGFRLKQLLTATFCHRNYGHLSGNLFGLYIYGRSAERQIGAMGLLFSYLVSGVVGNLVSLFWLRGNVVSCGASGAVFGLFVVATLSTLRLEWRCLVEFLVLGQFAWSQVQTELTGPAVAGVNSVAHLSGAVGGIFSWIFLERRRK